MRKRHVVSLLLGLSTVAVVGCAQEVGDIDRTSPNKLKKTVFEGEWYMRQTVVGVPGTANAMFTGFEGEVNRIRFRFQEDSLVAHRVHEDVLGIDTKQPPNKWEPEYASPYTKYQPGEEDYYGAPVAAFGVSSHFDVQRQYNSSTGEQTNVISENTSDRYWDEREYARVDWGANKISLSEWDTFMEINTMSDLSWYEAGFDDSSPLYVECKDATTGEFYDCDPDDLEAQENIAYLEITSAYIIAPDWIDCVLSFGFPFYAECGPQTIKVRTSFVKIDEEEVAKHEPRVYDYHDMEWFGFFQTSRCEYDTTYGCRDQTSIHLANIHNIWMDWRDANGERLEYSAREPRPIVYYLSEDYPADLIDNSLQIADQYDAIFKEIVYTAQGQTSWTRDHRMFYLCANNGGPEEREALQAAVNELHDEYVGYGYDKSSMINALYAGYDAGYCKRPGKTKNIGDIRYSQFYWVNNNQQVGPLGYGPSTPDPLTGQVISANAYIYGSALDGWAQGALDVIDLINGDVDPEEFGYGSTITGYVRDAEKLYNVPSSERGETIEQLEAERMAALQADVQLMKERRTYEDIQGKLSLDPSVFIRHDDRYRGTWEQMKGTELEYKMITPDIKAGFGQGLVEPDAEVDQEVVDMLSPRYFGLMEPNGLSTSLLNGLPNDPTKFWERFDRLADQNIYMADFVDDAMLGLAMEYRDKYRDLDPGERRLRIWYELRGRLFNHVMEHEVGHTVGLRHNFEASYDSMSYHPEYWNIRFESDRQFGYDHAMPDRGLTVLDHEHGIRNYSYSSTMDYGSSPSSQTHGLGLYDKAALAYGYAGLVHVFEEAPNKIRYEVDGNGYPIEEVGTTKSTQLVEDFDDIDEVYSAALGTDDWLDAGLNWYHYSVLPIMFSNPEDPNATMDKMYQRKFVPKSEYDNGGELRVPYRFCSDTVRGGTPSCNVFDEGSDYVEIAGNYAQAYNSYYFHNNYRRGRTSFGLWIWPHFQRLLYRYFSPMASMYQFWLIRASSWGGTWQLDPYGGAYQELAASNSFRTLLGVLSQPHPGTYYWDDTEGMFMNISNNTGARYSNDTDETNYIDLEPGLNVRWRFSRYDYDGGYYYWFRYSVLTSFWDRWAAMMAMTNPESDFLAVDSSSDITGYLLPYYLYYDVEMAEAFGGIILEEYPTFSPVVAVSDLSGTGGSRDVPFAMQDPLASIVKKQEYRDPTKYRFINPYPADYGNTSFNDRYFATAYSLAFFQSLYDQSFNHASEVFIVGSGSGWEIPQSARVDVTQTSAGDPISFSIDGVVFQTVASADDADTAAELAGMVADAITNQEIVGIFVDYLPTSRYFDITIKQAGHRFTYEAIEGATITPRTITVETYTDPFNQKTYAAATYNDYDFYGRKIFPPGINMIRKANREKAQWQQSNDYGDKIDLQNTREDIETMIIANRAFADISSPYWILYF